MEHITIKTIADIRDKIPSDKIDAFLADLKIWCNGDSKKVADAYCRIIEAIGASLGIQAERSLENRDVMLWVDDGQVGLSQIALKTKDGKTLQTIKLQEK